MLMVEYPTDLGFTAREVEKISLWPSSQKMFGTDLPLGTNPWSRFSDAKLEGWIEPTGAMRKGENGQFQEVFQVTELGKKIAEAEWIKVLRRLK